MASDKEYLDYVLDGLSALDGVTSRAMMGEYIIYYKGAVVGGVYDNRFLVKNTPSASRLLPENRLETPYPGAKPMVLITDPDDRDTLAALIPKIAEDLKK